MREPSQSLEICPVCGGDRFTNEPVLWPELIEQWELSPDEVAYIDLQQGFCCADCKNNLRTMTLAAAVTRAFGFAGSFKDFCRNDAGIRQLTVIEINPAKNLSPFLQAASQTCAPFLPRARHAANELCGFIDRHHHSFRHAGACSRLKGRFERVHARSETGRPFVLYRANCHWAPDADPARFASKLSRKTGSEPGRLRGANRIRRRFLVPDFRGRISRSKPDKPDLPCIRGNPRNQNVKAERVLFSQ